MKSSSRLFICIAVFLFVIMSYSFRESSRSLDALTGAWQLQNAAGEQVLLFMDGYFTHTMYNLKDRKFVHTHGGTYQITNNQITAVIEFDTRNKDRIGQSATYRFSADKGQLQVDINGIQERWNQLDNGTAPLAGVWRITERMQDGALTAIHQTGARKTLKILTGTRFQWAAINPETKEFSGTGGGRYTFANGKYTEHIEFFSRDSSRVGASLSFDGKLESGKWHHSGLSSRGDKIYEVWSKVK